jgi:hypothetical protein
LLARSLDAFGYAPLEAADASRGFDYEHLPVLILTGVTLSTDDALRVRALGAHPFYKPQPVATLVHELDELLGKRRV